MHREVRRTFYECYKRAGHSKLPQRFIFDLCPQINFWYTHNQHPNLGCFGISFLDALSRNPISMRFLHSALPVADSSWPKPTKVPPTWPSRPSQWGSILPFQANQLLWYGANIRSVSYFRSTSMFKSRACLNGPSSSITSDNETRWDTIDPAQWYCFSKEMREAQMQLFLFVSFLSISIS